MQCVKKITTVILGSSFLDCFPSSVPGISFLDCFQWTLLECNGYNVHVVPGSSFSDCFSFFESWLFFLLLRFVLGCFPSIAFLPRLLSFLGSWLFLLRLIFVLGRFPSSVDFLPRLLSFLGPRLSSRFWLLGRSPPDPPFLSQSFIVSRNSTYIH